MMCLKCNHPSTTHIGSIGCIEMVEVVGEWQDVFSIFCNCREMIEPQEYKKADFFMHSNCRRCNRQFFEVPEKVTAAGCYLHLYCPECSKSRLDELEYIFVRFEDVRRSNIR